MPDEVKTFDAVNPDKKFVKQVLWQAFDGGMRHGAIGIYAEAWCLRDFELKDYRALEKFMLDDGLISEWIEDGIFSLTEKGRRIANGEEYE